MSICCSGPSCSRPCPESWPHPSPSCPSGRTNHATPYCCILGSACCSRWWPSPCSSGMPGTTHPASRSCACWHSSRQPSSSTPSRGSPPAPPRTPGGGRRPTRWQSWGSWSPQSSPHVPTKLLQCRALEEEEGGLPKQLKLPKLIPPKILRLRPHHPFHRRRAPPNPLLPTPILQLLTPKLVQTPRTTHLKPRPLHPGKKNPLHGAASHCGAFGPVTRSPPHPPVTPPSRLRRSHL